MFIATLFVAYSWAWGDWLTVLLNVPFLPIGWFNFRAAVRQWQTRLAPPRKDFGCPDCRQAPPIGTHWRCAKRHRLDVFENGGACPACGGHVWTITCPRCGTSTIPEAWDLSRPPTPISIPFTNRALVWERQPGSYGLGLPDGSLIDRARLPRTFSGQAFAREGA